MVSRAMRGMAVAALLALAAISTADTFIWGCMVGSNNKLNERNNGNNRANDNRLYDSQNGAGGGNNHEPSETRYDEDWYITNDAATYGGGYRHKYYIDSELTMEWVNQHGSGHNGGVRSNFVWQYMCDNMGSEDASAIPWDLTALRDGNDTQTVDYDPNDATASDDPTRGMHEPYAWYKACDTRERNKGLFVGDEYDELVGDETAIYTMQDSAGTRYGLECPEERDYYPYWHPTPWTDYAVLTSEPERCEYYASNSFNERSYGICEGDESYNNERDCNNGGGDWETYGPLKDKFAFVDTPICQESMWSRENHLGYTVGGHMNQLNVTVWDNKDSECVMRIRYNISTADVTWNMDSKFNDENSPIRDTVGQNNNNNMGIEQWAPESDWTEIPIYVAANTDQFPRSFEDRTYVFSIRERPSWVPATAKIYNLGVKGTRGNLQDIYPMVERDYCPQDLVVKEGDFVHIQIHGDNSGKTFNRNNAIGGGFDQKSDRSNIMQVEEGKTVPMPFEDVNMFDNKDDIIRAAFVGQNRSLCDPDETGETALGNCGKINAKSHGYIDLGLFQQNSTGTRHFISTRNNLFSNRAMRGKLTIEPALSAWALAAIILATIVALAGIAIGGLALAARQNPAGSAAQLLSRFPGAN